MSSDFDEIFGDLKEDEQCGATLAFMNLATHVPPSDFDETSIFGDLSASSTVSKLGEDVVKHSVEVTTPLPAPAVAEVVISSSSVAKMSPPALSSKPSWEQMGGTEQDDFLSWLDDGSVPAPAASTQQVAEEAGSMDDITLDADTTVVAVHPLPVVAEIAHELAPAIAVHIAEPPSASITNVSLGDDDDDDDFLERMIENAKKKPSNSRESSLHIKSQSSSLSQEPTQDMAALTKTYLATGTVPAAIRLTLWRHAIQVDSKESISMYALQTTPLDLESQAVLRKEIESLCGIIFSSKFYLEIIQSSGDSADGARLLFIDSAEILMTYLCKKLRMDYPAGLVTTFAPLITASGNDPLRLELVETLTAVCHRVLPHLPKHIPTRVVANARRPLLKWLLFYHAPAVAFHLDQHFHTWNLGTAEQNRGSSSAPAMDGAIPDAWVASMFESENNQEFDFLVKVWDTCVMLNMTSSSGASEGSSSAPHLSPSTSMCFIIVHLIMRCEKKLSRMEGEQLRHCMTQTLLDALKDERGNLVVDIQKLIEATPPSFCSKLRDIGYVQPPVAAPNVPSTEQSTEPTVVKASSINNLGVFSLISASTTGVKELSSMMIDMPTKLLTIGSSTMKSATTSASSGSKEDTHQNAKQLFQQLSEAGSGGSALTMTLSTEEVIPQVFQSFQAPIADEKIRFFILDCRAADELRDGQIPTAFHFDPDAVTDRQVVDQVLATLNPMKSKVHLVIMGHGYGRIADEIRLQQEKLAQQAPLSAPVGSPQSPFMLKEDFFAAYATDLTRVNSALLFLTRQGFPYVSILEGGFAAAHGQLFHSSAFTVDDLIDHNAPQCSFCQHHRSMAAPGTGVPGISSSPLPMGALNGTGDAEYLTNGADFKQESSSRTTSRTASRGSSSSTMPAQKPAHTGELDAKSLFDAHAGPSGSSYFSSFAGALKTSGKTFMNPADSLKDSTKWLMKKTVTTNDGASKSESKDGAASASADRASMTSALPKFNKIRSSLVAMGSESLDMLKKAEQATIAKTRLPFGSSMSPASSPNVKPPSVGGSGTPPAAASTRADARTASGSSSSGARNASFKKSEEEVFTIDDDEEEEQDDFVGGGGGDSSRTSSSSSTRNESFSGRNGTTGDANAAALVLHSVEKGHVGTLKKGMRVSRVQMLPCVESPFFSGYKKKKTDARVSMLPRRLVITENHLVVLKAERNLDDVYMVKSCHTLLHIVRMTCLKKNALMVTVYYKWKRADTGETIEKRNSYEVQQRDEFIKAIRGAMEKM